MTVLSRLKLADVCMCLLTLFQWNPIAINLIVLLLMSDAEFHVYISQHAGCVCHVIKANYL